MNPCTKARTTNLFCFLLICIKSLSISQAYMLKQSDFTNLNPEDSKFTLSNAKQLETRFFLKHLFQKPVLSRSNKKVLQQMCKLIESKFFKRINK